MLAETLSDLAIRLDPSLILDEMGFPEADPWQRRLLRSGSERMLINCHRQAGKSTATAGLAVGTARYTDDALVLIVSRSLRQSRELFRKVTAAYDAMGAPLGKVEDSADTLTLGNGSRVVSLPNNPDTIVGFSAPQLVIIDEASRVQDDVYAAVMPMLAISRGRLVAMSTPRGRRGWWADQWHEGGDSWERVEFKASQNHRLDPEWLAEQRVLLGERWFNQEFMCSFEESIGQVFSTESIDAAFESEAEPLRLGA